MEGEIQVRVMCIILLQLKLYVTAAWHIFGLQMEKASRYAG
jgi:hypothetical protein